MVGAGTAGAAAAALGARAGLRVLCVDRGELDRAGARWVNGVPARDFDDAGFDRPRGEELRGDGGPFHLVAGYGPARLVIEDHGVLEVDMRHLVARLQAAAREAGAALVGGVSVLGVEGNLARTSAGSVRAEVVVDAAGLSGPNLLGQPAVRRGDLCTAAQEVRAITDHAAAARFFESHQTPIGQVVCFTGIAGGYSILNCRADGDQVSILTGSIPGPGRPSGRQILDRFVAEKPWIGARVFGGARAIPIRRPFDRIADGRIAAIGDAAAQVFPAHGSGIGAGMVAARYLIDAVAGGGGLGAYATRWQRERGGLFAAYDLFRRFSERLTPATLSEMMSGGLMDPELARAGMAQELPRPAPGQLARKIPGLLRNPQLAAGLGGLVAKMAIVLGLYARYPQRPEALPVWSRRVARVFGEAPDRPGA